VLVYNMVRYQVLTAASMNITVSWDVAYCKLIKFTDVSEVLSVSVIRAMIVIMTMGSSRISETRKTGDV
jgi:hypothetical protein